MLVVSDTSPLNYLILINAIDVLPKLFGEVYVPPMVMEELLRLQAPEVVKRWVQSPPAWLKVNAPATSVVLGVRLDPGEAYAIALAKELHATAILIDDKRGRRVVKEVGLEAVGTITVLQLAAQKELIELKGALNALRHTSFRTTPALIRAALDADAARRNRER